MPNNLCETYQLQNTTFTPNKKIVKFKVLLQKHIT
jgi:hypothetical protein